jgi:hypothetical protein
MEPVPQCSSSRGHENSPFSRKMRMAGWWDIKETLQESSVDEKTVIASKFGQLRTLGNVEIVDGIRGVRGSNLHTSTEMS